MSDDDGKDVRIKRDALHYMLGAVLVEIRAANSVHAAKKFADVFHNLPMSLLSCVTSADYDAEFFKLLERSKRWELDAYIKGLRILAERVVLEKENEGSGPAAPESRKMG